MVLHYETLMLAPTKITDDELSMIESNLEKICTEAQGKLTTFDKWGKYLLAYPVDGNSYGVYVLARYTMEKPHISKAVNNVTNLLRIKCSDILLRHVTVKLDEAQAAVYQKPEAMDASNSGSLDTFLKENKIENLLDSVESSSPSKAAPVTDFDEDDFEMEDNNEDSTK